MWLIPIGLAVGAIAARLLTAGRWRGVRYADLGWMSQQWLAEQRAADR